MLANDLDQDKGEGRKSVSGKSNLDLKADDLKTDETSDPKNNDKWKLFDTRFDYAWKWFDHHAKQRITVFNYSILFFGILANAYGLLIRENEYVPALVIGLSGLVIGFIFKLLDYRNEKLVHVGEDILRQLEKDLLFVNFESEIEWQRDRCFLGGWQPSNPEKTQSIGIISREENEYKDKPKGAPYRHGFWIPFCHYVVIFVFVLGAGHALNGIIEKTDDPVNSACDTLRTNLKKMTLPKAVQSDLSGADLERMGTLLNGLKAGACP